MSAANRTLVVPLRLFFIVLVVEPLLLRVLTAVNWRSISFLMQLLFLFCFIAFRMKSCIDWVFSLTVLFACAVFAVAENKQDAGSTHRLHNRLEMPGLTAKLKRTPWAPSEIRFSSADINHFLRTRNSAVRRRQKHSSLRPLTKRKEPYPNHAAENLGYLAEENNGKRAPLFDSSGIHHPFPKLDLPSIRARMLELMGPGKREQDRPRKSMALHPVRVGIGQHVADVALETFSRLLHAEENKFLESSPYKSRNTLNGEENMRFIG